MSNVLKYLTMPAWQDRYTVIQLYRLAFNLRVKKGVSEEAMALWRAKASPRDVLKLERAVAKRLRKHGLLPQPVTGKP